jgi:hypothetical protein
MVHRKYMHTPTIFTASTNSGLICAGHHIAGQAFDIPHVLHAVHCIFFPHHSSFIAANTIPHPVIVNLSQFVLRAQIPLFVAIFVVVFAPVEENMLPGTAIVGCVVATAFTDVVAAASLWHSAKLKFQAYSQNSLRYAAIDFAIHLRRVSPQIPDIALSMLYESPSCNLPSDTSPSLASHVLYKFPGPFQSNHPCRPRMWTICL